MIAMAALCTTALGGNGVLGRSRTQCSAAVPEQAVKTSSMTLHVGGDTSISLPMSRDEAKGVSTAIDSLFKTFSEKSKAKKPQRWDSLDFRSASEDTGVALELFCNPNGFTNAFQAKVLVTISDEKLSCTTEAQLTSLKADVEQFLG